MGVSRPSWGSNAPYRSGVGSRLNSRSLFGSGDQLKWQLNGHSGDASTMAYVHLHAGMPRAGSSALQTFCRSNPGLLAASGVAYPQIPRLTTKPFAAAACNGADLSNYICNDPTAISNGPEGLERIIAFLQTVKARHIVISSEFFFGADPRRLALLRDAFHAARLPLKVYLYVREPFEWLVSCYAQYVKSRSLTVDVNQYLLQALPDVRIADAIGDLKEVFGTSFELALYRRDELKDRDICSDFFGRMGIDLGPLDSAPDVNASANAVELEALRRFNQLIGDDLWSRLNGRRFLRFARDVQLEGPPIGRCVRQEVEEEARRRLDEEVAAIKTRFYPDRTEPLFAPPPEVERISLEELNESRLVRAITDSMVSVARLKERRAKQR